MYLKILICDIFRLLLNTKKARNFGICHLFDKKTRFFTLMESFIKAKNDSSLEIYQKK